MTLKDLPIGKTATVRAVGGEGALRHHFLDMGLIPTASVTMVRDKAPTIVTVNNERAAILMPDAA